MKLFKLHQLLFENINRQIKISMFYDVYALNILLPLYGSPYKYYKSTLNYLFDRCVDILKINKSIFIPSASIKNRTNKHSTNFK